MHHIYTFPGFPVAISKCWILFFKKRNVSYVSDESCWRSEDFLPPPLPPCLFVVQYPFGEDAVNFLLKPLEKSLKNSMHTYCGRSSHLFTKKLQESIRNLQDDNRNARWCNPKHIDSIVKGLQVILIVQSTFKGGWNEALRSLLHVIKKSQTVKGKFWSQTFVLDTAPHYRPCFHFSFNHQLMVKLNKCTGAGGCNCFYEQH